MVEGGDLDTSKWNIIYPNYINSKKTIPEGRRITQSKGVEYPHPAEMAEICEYLKIPHVLEMDKAYPRDWLIRGRIRVLLKTDAGAYTHSEIHTKKALMEKMSELIPKLKSRVQGPPQQMQAQASAGAVAGASGSASSAANKIAKKEAKREEKKAQKKGKK
mmetsp:Transcript_14766/g.29109  ORF Transcript_14766/g.29109 Transcript_14766/m.29109 type:complete len:161 (-) Transcript_14766:83-565(-)|eukprot:CAMPEP_0172662420 /NCGR_PEP_ID=MMETSP1074-20121228/5357_1 /TAXON_ID=2916 /ORGANISM="Ceratium fusus, Strain PA161109" /LENGTH=160 /DNA_ID=CAMNT_0013478337 /DNA_START=80 /DNA_END=562 /DNA_ORIENTATION=+